MNLFDYLYISFTSILWLGNFIQIARTIKTGDVSSFSMWWLTAFLVSWAGRIPRAATATEYRIWLITYGISFVIFGAFYAIVLYYKLKGRKGKRYEDE